MTDEYQTGYLFALYTLDLGKAVFRAGPSGVTIELPRGRWESLGRPSHLTALIKPS